MGDHGSAGGRVGDLTRDLLTVVRRFDLQVCPRYRLPTTLLGGHGQLLTSLV